MAYGIGIFSRIFGIFGIFFGFLLDFWDSWDFFWDVWDLLDFFPKKAYGIFSKDFPLARNHAYFLPVSRNHAINEKFRFSRKHSKIRRKTGLSRNHAYLLSNARNYAHFLTFSRVTHTSRFTQSRRNKIAFTQSRRKIRLITKLNHDMW